MIKEIKNSENFYLFPSTLFVARDTVNVVTVLGSCVAVCLYDSINKIGGINHYMLPLWNGTGLASPKFGNIAIERLLEEMLRNGAKKEYIIAKVFGGANQTNSTMYIGDRNIQIAIDLLMKFNIKIVSKSVGGEIGRKIMFDTSSGEVRMKFVGNVKQ